jgi:TRAP-type mannitol/chloroaromatic compound transport system permease small subunit
MGVMKKFVHAVDAFNAFIGKWFCLLILPLVFVVMYEVLLRRVFNAPTKWAFEMTVYLYGAHYMFGMGVTYLYDRHVRIDIIALQFPQKVQLWLRIITFWVIFVPFVGALTYAATKYAAHSWAVWEHSWSAWKPPLYPYKTVMPVTLFILFVQGFSTFIRDVYRLKGEEI